MFCITVTIDWYADKTRYELWYIAPSHPSDPVKTHAPYKEWWIIPIFEFHKFGSFYITSNHYIDGLVQDYGISVR